MVEGERAGESRREERAGRRGGGVALVFSLAALMACWNPVAAPFGLIAGIGAVVLSARRLRRATHRRIPAIALGLGVVAAVASATLLIQAAGVVSTELPGEPVVKGRTSAELDQTLSQAAERTRAQREKARQELERMSGSKTDGGTPIRSSGAASPDAGAPSADVP